RVSFLYLLLPRPPRPPLFPYTTLFRSDGLVPRHLSRQDQAGILYLANIVAEALRQPVALVKPGEPGLEMLLWVWLPAETGHQGRSEEHTSELQSRENLVCRLLLEKKK